MKESTTIHYLVLVDVLGATTLKGLAESSGLPRHTVDKSLRVLHETGLLERGKVREAKRAGKPPFSYSLSGRGYSELAHAEARALAGGWGL